jgi:hypothetical protein
LSSSSPPTIDESLLINCLVNSFDADVIERDASWDSITGRLTHLAVARNYFSALGFIEIDGVEVCLACSHLHLSAPPETAKPGWPEQSIHFWIALFWDYPGNFRPGIRRSTIALDCVF